MLSIFAVVAGCLINVFVVNGDVTIHHCSFEDTILAGGPNWYYEFNADDCTNGLPSGNCVASFKRTRPHCDARYAVLPGEIRTVGRSDPVSITGPAAIVHMGCGDDDDFGYDGGNQTNQLYEMDFLCVDGNDTSWRTLCDKRESPGNAVNQTTENKFRVLALFNESDCDNGLPSGDNCIQFIHNRLFPGDDFGQISFDIDDNRFPGMEFYVFRDTNVPITITAIAYICDVEGLADYVTYDSSGGDDDDDSSDSSASSDESSEFSSYICSVPDGNAGEVLDDFTNGNDRGDDTSVEYVWYKFSNNDCIDNEGNNKIPPTINNNKDCTVNIRSERGCGSEGPIVDLNTREAFNKNELDIQTGNKGPGILYTRPKNKNCNNKENNIRVEYLCVEK